MVEKIIMILSETLNAQQETINMFIGDVKKGVR